MRVSVFKVAVLGEKADQGEDNEAPEDGNCNQEALDDWVEEEVLRDDTGLVSLEIWDEKHGFICLVKRRQGDPGVLLFESVLFGNDDTAIRLLKGNRAISTLTVTLDHASLVWSAN